MAWAALWLAPGPAAAGDGPPKDSPSAAQAAVALLALDACFTGRWEDGDGPIFVEAGPLVPAGLRRVGRYTAEVVTEADLKKRFAGKPVGPGLARVKVEEGREKGETVYTATVVYSGVVVEGARGVLLGGTRWYKYTVAGGKVTVVDQGDVKH